jgi:hypothetical protein
MVGAANYYKRGGFVIAVTLGGILKVQSAPGRIGRLYMCAEREREKKSGRRKRILAALRRLHAAVCDRVQ